MRTNELIQPLSLAAILFAAYACSPSSSSTGTIATSSVTGALVGASFPSAPQRVTATNEAGVQKETSIGNDGSFRLDLAKAHTYKFVIHTATGQEPMVFPRAGGHLDQTVQVTSGAAVVDLGKIRHYAGAPSGGFTLISSGGGCTEGNENCVEDGAPAQCTQGPSGTDSSADPPDQPDNANANANANANDGECQNGVDAVTGKACSDGDPTDEADGAGPMAVPSKDPPDNVSGCDDHSDGETSD